MSKANPSKPARVEAPGKKLNEVGAEFAVELSDTQLQAAAGGRVQRPYIGETEKNERSLAWARRGARGAGVAVP